MADKILFDESFLYGPHALEAGPSEGDPGSGDELRARIDRLVTPVRGGDTRSAPVVRKSDLLVPVATAAGAVIAVLLVAFISALEIRRSADEIALDSSARLGGEGLILQRYKEESERQGRQRDAEVLNVLRQLEELQRRSVGLAAVVEKGLAMRESQIAQDTEAQLARERALLEAEGARGDEAESRLRALRERVTAESHEELERLRRQGDLVLSAQQAQLLSRVERAKEQLGRVDVPPEPSAGGAAITARRPQTADAHAASEAEELAITQQVAANLSAALDLIQRSDYEAAAGALDRVRDLLSREAAERSPAVTARRASDLAIVEALRGYLAARRQDSRAGSAVSRAQTADRGPGPAVGRVALVDGKRAVVEAFDSSTLAPGSVVDIRRPDAGGEARIVARARVTETAGEPRHRRDRRGGRAPGDGPGASGDTVRCQGSAPQRARGGTWP